MGYQIYFGPLTVRQKWLVIRYRRLAFHRVNYWRLLYRFRDLDEIESEALYALVLAARSYNAVQSTFGGHALRCIDFRLRKVFTASKRRCLNVRDLDLNLIAAETSEWDDEIGDDVAAALASLDQRSREAVTGTIVDGRTLEAVGKDMGGITKERVRQLRKQALSALAEKLNCNPMARIGDN